MFWIYHERGVEKEGGWTYGSIEDTRFGSVDWVNAVYRGIFIDVAGVDLSFFVCIIVEGHVWRLL